ncbi:MAG: hypothetical protein AAGD32_14240 [Planctomycetota bacterium]
MHDQADVRSFQALEALRIALVKFADTAASAVESTEGVGNETLHWLENQAGHWKAETRKAREWSERAKDAYRQKIYFSDATGAKQSAIEEMIDMRKAAARVEVCDDKSRATARNKPLMRREIDQYRGSTGRLKGMLDREIPVTLAKLAQAIQNLEAYAAAKSEPMTSRIDGPPPSMANHATPTDSDGALPDAATLRKRTPKPQVRRKAARSSAVPPLPDVPPDAREAAARLLEDDPPGRYDALTLALTGDEPALYLERLTPADDADTGWHVGPATAEPGTAPVVTLTHGKLAAKAPHLAELLRLPVGSCVVSSGGAVCRIVDPLGRVIWEDADGDR